jgi:hypothetical protein
MESESSPLAAKSRFKPLEARVESSDPFVDDKLNRKSEIENLSSLLVNSETPLVLAIDASWGSGKTTFIKMWKAHLSKEYSSCLSVYFSAWDTDLAEDPLYAFLGEINEQLASRTSGMSRYKWEQTINLAGKIAKRSLSTLAKVATHGALNINDQAIERALAELSGEIVSDGLDAYKASLSAVQQFKENLSFVLGEVCGENPIIIFVDELDRCRPQYAISLLERIKHLFNLPGIIFVLGIDRIQLANAIRGAYGAQFDSETYLQRFIDLDYRLSPGGIKAFIAKLVTDYNLIEFFGGRKAARGPFISDESENLVDACADVAGLFNMSLREVEQLLARVNIVARSTLSSQPIYPHLLVGLLALRCKEPDLYLSLSTQKSSTLEVIRLVAQKWESAILKSVENIGIMAACMVLAFSGADSNDPGFAFVTAQVTAETGVGSQEKELMASTAEYIRHIGAQPSMRINLEGLIQRIEMAQSFLV